MDVLSRISGFFSSIYDSASGFFQSEEPAGKISEAKAAADRFEPLKPIDTRRIEELVRESQPVRVGCYIETHEFHEVRIEEWRELRRQLPATR